MHEYPTPPETILSPEVISLLEQQYSFEAYVGSHGHVSKQPRVYNFFVEPANSEYEAVANVVAGMSKEDMLFIEGPGKGGEAENPLPSAPTHGAAAEIMQKVIEDYRDHMQAKVERSRAQARIDAWDYGALTALLKGIPVIYADCTAADLQSMGGGDAVARIIREDPAARPSIYSLREARACEIMLARAVQQLNLEQPRDGSKKRRMVLLFGAGGDHPEGLQKCFTTSGIDLSITHLPQASLVERTNDKLSRLTQRGYQTIKRILPLILREVSRPD